MPLYGLKLLSVILERNAAFVIILKKLQLTSVLLEYFSAGHAKFNAFTVKIVRVMVASREISIEELLQHDIITKLNKIMQDVVGNNAEWASDHLLIIMNEILHLAAELKKNDANSKVPQ
jgi:predicted site-specific integrase-resolvase